MPASIAAPTSSTCTWTFHRPSLPTTTRESPSPASVFLQHGDPVVLGVEEVHHLVRRTALDEVGGMRGRRRQDRHPAGRHGAGHRATAGEDGLGGVEDHAQPAPAGVHHAGVAEHRQQVGGAGQRLAGPLGRGGEHVARPGARPGRPLVGRVGRGAGDGEDGALDRRADRGVARVRRPLQRVGDDLGVALVGTRLRRSGGRARPSISLRITPELPRAPSRAPRLSAARAAARSVSGSPPPVASRRASRAADTVRYMFVPVSPSGTG